MNKREELHISDGSRLIEIMVCCSPSNAYIERLIFDFQLIKTEMRSSLNQSTLNNLFRVSKNSTPMETFDATPIIEHWRNLSVKAGKGRLFIEGETVTSIFRLRSDYRNKHRISDKTQENKPISAEALVPDILGFVNTGSSRRMGTRPK